MVAKTSAARSPNGMVMNCPAASTQTATIAQPRTKCRPGSMALPIESVPVIALGAAESPITNLLHISLHVANSFVADVSTSRHLCRFHNSRHFCGWRTTSGPLAPNGSPQGTQRPCGALCKIDDARREFVKASRSVRIASVLNESSDADLWPRDAASVSPTKRYARRERTDISV